MCKKYWWSKSEIHNIFEQSLRNRKVSEKYLDKKFKKIGESKWANIFRWFRFATESRKLFYAVMCKIPRHIPPPPLLLPPWAAPVRSVCWPEGLTGADDMRLESSLTNQSRPPPAPSQWEAGWGVVSRRTGCQKHLINPGVTDSRQALQPRPQRGQVSSAASILCASLSLSLSLSRIIASQSYALLDTYNYF